MTDKTCKHCGKTYYVKLHNDDMCIDCYYDRFIRPDVDEWRKSFENVERIDIRDMEYKK